LDSLLKYAKDIKIGIIIERIVGIDGLYTLSDAYAHARACTYFKIYEGFCNSFVEPATHYNY